MTWRSDRDPQKRGRAGVRNEESASRRPFVDTGWEGYDPAATDAAGGASGEPRPRKDRRNYKSAKSGGLSTVARFAVFTVVLASLVLGGL